MKNNHFATTRNQLVDSARALGIILVVLGHTLSPTAFATHLIYSFHMPLFFLLAGLMVNRQCLETPLPAFLRSKAFRLFVPYLCFGIVLYIPWVMVFRHYGADAAIAWYKPLVGMAYGLGTGGYLQHDIPLWFFPCMFVALTILRLTATWQRPLTVAIASAALGLALSASPVRLPWSLDTALLAMPFLIAGRQLQHMESHQLQSFFTHTSTRWAALLLAPLWLTLVSGNGLVDMNSVKLGNGGIITFYAAAAAGLFLVLTATAALPASRAINLLSRNTIWIFPLHLPLFSLCKGSALMALHLPLTVWNLPLGITALTFVGIIAPLATQEVFTQLKQAFATRRATAGNQPLPAFLAGPRTA